MIRKVKFTDFVKRAMWEGRRRGIRRDFGIFAQIAVKLPTPGQKCEVKYIDGCINGLREQNKSCISEEMFSRGSKCNNKEYTVLEGSAGRKIISNKNETKQFIKRKTTYLETWNQLATVSCGKYYIYGTCTENSNGRRIERPFL